MQILWACRTSSRCSHIPSDIIPPQTCESNISLSGNSSRYHPFFAPGVINAQLSRHLSDVSWARILSVLLYVVQRLSDFVPLLLRASEPSPGERITVPV